MNVLKQSTAATVVLGPFVDPGDAVTEETGLTPAVELSKAGGAFASASDGATAHLAEGWYDCDLDTTDTGTLGELVIKAQDSANHLPVWARYQVVPANVYDSLIAGSDTLDVQATGIADGAITSSTVTAGGAEAIANVATGTITQTRGDHWIIAFSGLGDVSARTEFWLTCKNVESDADSAALFLISEGTGLEVLNGAAADTATDGAITVSDAAAGTGTVVVKSAATAALPIRGDLKYDYQVLRSSGTLVETLEKGTFEITWDATRTST